MRRCKRDTTAIHRRSAEASSYDSNMFKWVKSPMPESDASSCGENLEEIFCKSASSSQKRRCPFRIVSKTPRHGFEALIEMWRCLCVYREAVPMCASALLPINDDVSLSSGNPLLLRPIMPLIL